MYFESDPDASVALDPRFMSHIDDVDEDENKDIEMSDLNFDFGKNNTSTDDKSIIDNFEAPTRVPAIVVDENLNLENIIESVPARESENNSNFQSVPAQGLVGKNKFEIIIDNIKKLKNVLVEYIGSDPKKKINRLGNVALFRNIENELFRNAEVKLIELFKGDNVGSYVTPQYWRSKCHHSIVLEISDNPRVINEQDEMKVGTLYMRVGLNESIHPNHPSDTATVCETVWMLGAQAKNTAEKEIEKQLFCGHVNNNRKNDEEKICPFLLAALEPDDVSAFTVTEYSEKDPQFADAIKMEMDKHVSNNVFRKTTEDEWKATTSPPIPSKLILTIKKDGRRKARLVCLGFLQSEKEHQKYAHVVGIESVRVMMSLLCNLPTYVARGADATNAYLQAPYPIHETEPTIIKVPPALHTLLQYQYGTVLRCMNGLVHSAIGWEKERNRRLFKCGWRCSSFDRSIFIKGSSFLLSFVDDFLLVADENIVDEEMKQLESVIELVKDKKIVHPDGSWSIKYLSMEIHVRDEDPHNNGRRTIKIGQEFYTDKICKKYGFQNSNYVPTPGTTENLQQLRPYKMFEQGKRPDENPECLSMRRSMVGSLIHLSGITRPDIHFHVSSCSRALAEEKNIECLKRILRYCRKMKYLEFKGSYDRYNTHKRQELRLEMFSDSDFASDPHMRRSITGSACYLNGCLISWSSGVQPSIATSTTEAELFASSQAAKQLKKMEHLVKSLILPEKFEFKSVSLFRLDNSAVARLTSFPEITPGLKHLHVRWFYLRELAKNKEVEVEYVESAKNCADRLTKALDRSRFENWMDELGMVE